MKKTIRVFLGIAMAATSVQAASLFWKIDDSAGTLTSANWGTTSSGPFTTAWTNNSDINFTASSTITNVTNTPIGNITVTNGSTVSWGPVGTLSLNSLVRTFDVGAGSILDMSSQGFSTAGSTGVIKNGAGIYFSSNGNTYAGGFTLNAGTVIAGGVNAMGGGGVLTINGGTIAANGTRTFNAGKFTSITVGGDFTLGGVTTGVASGNGSATANLTFNDATGLGAATRKITIGANGTYTLAGVVSGAAGTGLTVDAVSGATGKFVLSNINTYSGPTTINAGTLVLSGAGTAGTGDLRLNGGKLDLGSYTGNTGVYALGATQTLSGAGTIAGTASKSLAVAGALSAGNAGAAGTITLDTLNLTLAGTSTFKFTNTSLTLGTYDLVVGTALGGTESVTFGGTLALNFTGGTYSDAVVKIFDVDSYGGTFSSVTYSGLGAGQSAAFDAATGDVTITTVPEPQTWALLGAGLATGLFFRRRQFRR